MNKLERLRVIAAELAEMFPHATSSLTRYGSGNIEVGIHDCGDYANATKVARELGIKKRDKQTHNPESPWFALLGESEGIKFTLFGTGLPGTCHVETFTEKIPKQQTVDTGEFIEVERRKIVCTEQKHQPA